jgi:hypothetical protein
MTETSRRERPKLFRMAMSFTRSSTAMMRMFSTPKAATVSRAPVMM